MKDLRAVLLEPWRKRYPGLSALIRYGRETYGDAIGYSVAAPLALKSRRRILALDVRAPFGSTQLM